MRVMISMLGDTFAEIIEEMLVTPLHIPDSPAWLRIAKKVDDLAEAERKARTLLRLVELRRIAVDDAR